MISNNASLTPEQITADIKPGQVFAWQLYAQFERKESEDVLFLCQQDSPYQIRRLDVGRTSAWQERGRCEVEEQFLGPTGHLRSRVWICKQAQRRRYWQIAIR